MSASLTRLQSFYGELKPPLLLHAMLKREFPGTIALLTSFAADAGLLLSMVAETDPATPVLYLNRGGEPPETPDYGRNLCAQLGLNNLRMITPPLAHALDAMGILALITGRSDARLPRIELDDGGVFRIHALARWSRQQVTDELARRNIPPHPLGDSAGFESAAFAEAGSGADIPAFPDWTL